MNHPELSDEVKSGIIIISSLQTAKLKFKEVKHLRLNYYTIVAELKPKHRIYSFSPYSLFMILPLITQLRKFDFPFIDTIKNYNHQNWDVRIFQLFKYFTS